MNNHAPAKGSSPESTLVIIFGASNWPQADLKSLKSFANSAQAVTAYFLDPYGFCLPSQNLINLFDSPKPPNVLDKVVSTFIENRSEQLLEEGNELENVLFYYVGHGLLVGNNQTYSLAIRSTRKDNYKVSTYSIEALAKTLQEKARHKRQYIILDACFAASAYSSFQSSVSDVVRQKALKTFPMKGASLLCSTGPFDPAIAPIGEDFTMFSWALLKALREGNNSISGALSLRDIGSSVEELINEKYHDEAVRPEVLSPRQREGDIGSMPLFPNWAFNERKETFVATREGEVDLAFKTIEGYYSIHPQLESLALWLEHTLRELAHHEEFIYSYSVRIKGLESLHGKIEEKIKKEKAVVNDFRDIIDIINDFVGGRLMLYVPGEILNIHLFLMALARIKILKIIIHRKAEQFTQLVDDITRTSLVDPIEEINTTGYFGVHYVLEPRPSDNYYNALKVPLFTKFELQLRTLMQHAWSEVQHKVIYKSNRPEYTELANPQFSLLSEILTTCDSAFDKLCESIRLTPTHDDEVELPEVYVKMVGSIKNAVARWESENVSSSVRNKEGKTIMEEYNIIIVEINKETTEANVDAVLSLAELYLKSSYFKKAYDLYKNVLPITKKRGWVYLRFAEACHGLADDEKAKMHLQELNNFLQKRESSDQNKDDYNLYKGALLVAWEVDQLNLAISFGEHAVNLSNNDTLKYLSSTLNLVYYKVNAWREEHKAEPAKLLIHLVELQPDVDKVSGVDEILFTPGKFDTLVYYYYCLADAYYIAGDKQRARDNLERAKEFKLKCFSKWGEKEPNIEKLITEAHERWAAHATMISTLEEKLGSTEP